MINRHIFFKAKAATGYFKEAEDLLVQINDPDIRHQQTFEMVLARCHINSGHAEHVRCETFIWKLIKIVLHRIGMELVHE